MSAAIDDVICYVTSALRIPPQVSL